MNVVSNETEKRGIVYSAGWFGEENANNQSWRWMTSHSVLWVHSDDEQNKSIEFTALSFDRPYNLRLQVDGNNSGYSIDPENYSAITSPLHLHAGYTALQFDVPDGCTRPSDITRLNSSDTRCLSIVVRNMTIS